MKFNLKQGKPQQGTLVKGKHLSKTLESTIPDKLGFDKGIKHFDNTICMLNHKSILDSLKARTAFTESDVKKIASNFKDLINLRPDKEKERLEELMASHQNRSKIMQIDQLRSQSETNQKVLYTLWFDVLQAFLKLNPQISVNGGIELIRYHIKMNLQEYYAYGQFKTNKINNQYNIFNKNNNTITGTNTESPYFLKIITNLQSLKLKAMASFLNIFKMLELQIIDNQFDRTRTNLKKQTQSIAASLIQSYRSSIKLFTKNSPINPTIHLINQSLNTFLKIYNTYSMEFEKGIPKEIVTGVLIPATEEYTEIMRAMGKPDLEYVRCAQELIFILLLQCPFKLTSWGKEVTRLLSSQNPSNQALTFLKLLGHIKDENHKLQRYDSSPTHVGPHWHSFITEYLTLSPNFKDFSPQKQKFTYNILCSYLQHTSSLGFQIQQYLTYLLKKYGQGRADSHRSISKFSNLVSLYLFTNKSTNYDDKYTQLKKLLNKLTSDTLPQMLISIILEEQQLLPQYEFDGRTNINPLTNQPQTHSQTMESLYNFFYQYAIHNVSQFYYFLQSYAEDQSLEIVDIFGRLFVEYFDILKEDNYYGRFVDNCLNALGQILRFDKLTNIALQVLQNMGKFSQVAISSQETTQSTKLELIINKISTHSCPSLLSHLFTLTKLRLPLTKWQFSLHAHFLQLSKQCHPLKLTQYASYLTKYLSYLKYTNFFANSQPNESNFNQYCNLEFVFKYVNYVLGVQFDGNGVPFNRFVAAEKDEEVEVAVKLLGVIAEIHVMTGNNKQSLGDVHSWISLHLHNNEHLLSQQHPNSISYPQALLITLLSRHTAPPPHLCHTIFTTLLHFITLTHQNTKNFNLQITKTQTNQKDEFLEHRFNIRTLFVQYFKQKPSYLALEFMMKSNCFQEDIKHHHIADFLWKRGLQIMSLQDAIEDINVLSSYFQYEWASRKKTQQFIWNIMEHQIGQVVAFIDQLVTPHPPTTQSTLTLINKTFQNLYKLSLTLKTTAPSLYIKFIIKTHPIYLSPLNLKQPNPQTLEVQYSISDTYLHALTYFLSCKQFTSNFVKLVKENAGCRNLISSSVCWFMGHLVKTLKDGWREEDQGRVFKIVAFCAHFVVDLVGDAKLVAAQLKDIAHLLSTRRRHHNNIFYEQILATMSLSSLTNTPLPNSNVYYSNPNWQLLCPFTHPSPTLTSKVLSLPPQTFQNKLYMISICTYLKDYIQSPQLQLSTPSSIFNQLPLSQVLSNLFYKFLSKGSSYQIVWIVQLLIGAYSNQVDQHHSNMEKIKDIVYGNQYLQDRLHLIQAKIEWTYGFTRKGTDKRGKSRVKGKLDFASDDQQSNLTLSLSQKQQFLAYLRLFSFLLFNPSDNPRHKHHQMSTLKNILKMYTPLLELISKNPTKINPSTPLQHKLLLTQIQKPSFSNIASSALRQKQLQQLQEFFELHCNCFRIFNQLVDFHLFESFCIIVSQIKQKYPQQLVEDGIAEGLYLMLQLVIRKVTFYYQKKKPLTEILQNFNSQVYSSSYTFASELYFTNSATMTSHLSASFKQLSSTFKTIIQLLYLSCDYSKNESIKVFRKNQLRLKRMHAEIQGELHQLAKIQGEEEFEFLEDFRNSSKVKTETASMFKSNTMRNH